MRHLLAVTLLASAALAAAAQPLTPPSARVLAAGLAKALKVPAAQPWEDAKSPACRATFAQEVRDAYGGSREAALADLGGLDVYCLELSGAAATALQRDVVALVRPLVPSFVRVYARGVENGVDALGLGGGVEYRVRVVPGKRVAYVIRML